MNLCRNLLKSVFPKAVARIESRNVSVSSALRIKEVRTIEKDNTLIIYGEELPSPREPYLLKNPHTTKCAVCASGLDIKHTDVLILSQFVRSDGCMLPKRITRLCNKAQKRIGTLVTMAQKAGLMPNLAPSWSKKDPKRRYQWKKYNKYFDETTIKS
ncbi:28S ribosomal protein S18a, mitochondrial [Anthonomus grandis grandis]|uniref:28S ribosomal protein S18a, mitochondrial n=1 Tax=Anthonomus grandis grandis TaxID=2921223 RepID=UPI002164F581|nr:28S ribosomal protein S18a, mitochondrial [Anthonomus grandis grandis]